VHFLSIGALLFLGERWDPRQRPASSIPAEPAADAPIVISAARVAALRDELRQQTGGAPTPAEEATLLRGTIDEELLYREALARGLDRDDRSVRYRLLEKIRFLRPEEAGTEPEALYAEALSLGLDRDDAIIRRMLIEKMRLLAGASVAEEAVSDAVLARFYAAHQDRYMQPARLSLTHVLLSQAARGEHLARDAADLLRELRTTQATPEAAVRRGDSFPLGHRVTGVTEHQLAKLLGPDFARAALDCPVGGWSGPLRSPFGLHLVFVDRIEPPSAAPLDAVRSRVLADYRVARRAEQVSALLDELRARYPVRVETAAGGQEVRS
jgi:hypothetical protein